jgi:nucleoside triphosphate pyrophosphatase
VKIVLASKSPRRQEMLRKAGIGISVCTAHVTEIESGIYYRQIPLVNAIAKANYVAEKFPDALVIGADTVIESDQLTIGKPLSLQHAAIILQQLSGRTHQVVSGVCLRCKNLNMQTVFSDITQVQFKTLSATIIAEYLKKVNVLDKAGAYAIQEYGEMLVDNIDGSLNNVIGLPIKKIIESLNLFNPVLER